MGAAAELARAADIEHPHLVAVLLAEEHDRAGFFRLLDRHDLRARRRVAHDLGVHLRLDAPDLVVRKRLVVREIETRLLAVDERSLLLYVRPEHVTQRLVHEVRHRVIAHRAAAQCHVDARLERVAHFERPGLQPPLVAVDLGLDLLRIGHLEGALRADELAAVADLAAGLGVERRAIEHYRARVAAGQRLRLRSLFVQRDNLRRERERFIAVKLGLAARVLQSSGGDELGRGARALALLRHGGLESRHVDHHAALAADIGGEVHREAIRVVQAEHRVAIEQPLAARERRLEHAHAVLKRLGEALLFLLEHIGDAVLGAAQLGIRIAHGAIEVGHQAVKEGLLLAELVAVADGAANDPPQHVAAAFVARNHAVDDEEAAGADVIGDDIERRAFQLARVRLARRGFYEILEEIDLVV